MPPKSNKQSQSKPSKIWKFMHEDSPNDESFEAPKQSNKKTQSEVKAQGQNKKQEFASAGGNKFSSIIDKYTALQQQKIEARKKKSESSKTLANTSRKAEIQKQPAAKSTLKKSESQKSSAPSNLKTLEYRESTLFQNPSTSDYHSLTQRQIVLKLIKQRSQSTNPSQSQMFANRSNVRTEPQRRASMESQWNRSSQVSTKSRVLLQYDKFFDNSQNVFLEESSMIKEEAVINYLIYKVIVIFFICVLFWLMIDSISPYEYQCPRHATCGAYIHCHEGYVLNRELKICQIDPETKNSGLAIMSSVIQDMKYEWGQKECTIPTNFTFAQIQEYLEPPRKTLHQIFTQYNIKSEQLALLRKVLTDYFEDKNQQTLGKFKIDYLNRIYPVEKLYRLQCQVELFYERNEVTFISCIILFFLTVIFSISQLSKQLFKNKAERIYKFLKVKAIEKKEINYDHYRLEIQEKFNSNTEISRELWELINFFRLQQKVIGSYEISTGNSSALIWRSLDAI